MTTQSVFGKAQDRRIITTLGIATMWVVYGGAAFAAAASVDRLRCEYRDNPLGIDVTAPRLSWELRAAEPARGVRQSAYQVLVASSPGLLDEDRGDLWDSGKTAGDPSNQIEYAGVALRSGARCHWKVRVWDETGKVWPWSRPASWTMGLLDQAEWQAQWIGYDEAYRQTPAQAADERLFNLGGLPWIKMPAKQGMPAVDTCLRKVVELPAARKIRRAVMVAYAYHECEVAVNGKELGSAAHWQRTARLDATAALKPGANVLRVWVRHTDPYLPAVIGKLVVQFESGPEVVVAMDASWKATQQASGAYDLADYDDSAWAAAEAGGIPWGGTPPVADLARMPAPYLRKEFALTNKATRATMHITALGTYELRMNGQRVGEDVLAPGWTEFRKRVHYQTYDVTDHLQNGANALGVVLGDGWYASDLAHLCRRNFYGGKPRLLARLDIQHDDGSRTVVVTDGSWKASYGPILHGDLLMGCAYDSRREMPGWDKPGFDDRHWQPVDAGEASGGAADVTAIIAAAVNDGKLAFKVENDALGGDPAFGKIKSLEVSYQLAGKDATKRTGEHGMLELAGPGLKILRARYGPESAAAGPPRIQAAVVEPSRVIEELPALKVTEPRPGRWTFDLGQNMVGWVRLKVRGEAGQRITLRHGEMLNADGTIYTAALRSCPAADEFVLAGNGEQVLEPCFTFHGFRYVEIRGLKSRPDAGMVTGRVVHTPMFRTGRFDSSHPMLNQLYRNIIWGQKGNYLEVPTDCPQRDERMGWTGDTQFFAPTAAYNFDVAAFFTRWLETCADNQNADGTFPFCVPDIMGGGGATGWGDAVLLCTYQIYRAYGDTRIVRERFDAMDRYMKWLAGKTTAGITRVGGFGDWLNAGGSAKAEVIDTAYHAHLAKILAEMAKAIGRHDDAARYEQRHAAVKAAFIREFVQADGSLKGCSQTGYALAFTMDLLPDEVRNRAADRFVDEIKRFNWHLATGFIGTPRLLPGLSMAGRDDVAYRLLLTDTYPSWLFPVKNGATTMWERWNGWTPDKGFGDLGMNSFNHYAFGAVGEYLYGGVGGIKAGSPGYKTLIIKPAIGTGLTSAHTSFHSIHGRIATDWTVADGTLSLAVVIPPNTRALVHVPATDVAAVKESGQPPAAARGVKVVGLQDSHAVFEVGSGTYHFTVPWVAHP